MKQITAEDVRLLQKETGEGMMLEINKKPRILKISGWWVVQKSLVNYCPNLDRLAYQFCCHLNQR